MKKSKTFMEELPWDSLRTLGDYFAVERGDNRRISIAAHHQSDLRKVKYKTMTIYESGHHNWYILVFLVQVPGLKYKNLVQLDHVPCGVPTDEIPF